ncbi:MAG: ABC transporter permease [Candidatus Njordarchaeales archaeon]
MLEVIKAVFKLRWKYTVRYPGWIIFFIIIPIIFSVIPIILGWAVAGGPQQAALNFKMRVGTEDYQFFIILGSAVWILGISVMWDFGMWIREEQEMGTLEQLLLTPANIYHILLGSTLFTTLLSSLQFLSVIIVGGLIFGFLPKLLNPQLLIAILYLFLGIFPLTGFALLLGCLIISIKEAEAVVRLFEPLLAFLVGAFYPITLMPSIVRYLAVTIPLTISLNDMRAVLLGLEYIFNPYLDLLILATYCVVWPALAMMAYNSVEKRAKKGGGLGAY